MQKLSKTVAIIGTGSVGASTAYVLLLKNLFAHILLADIDELKCKGELLDLSDAAGFSLTSSIKQVSIANAAQADIIIICAGKAQAPNQPRSELLQVNSKIISTIITQLGSLDPTTVIIMVTNPVDTLTYLAYHQSKHNPSLVIGTGTVIDTQRFTSIIENEVNINRLSISALVIGQHGELQIPIFSHASIAGNNLSQPPFDKLLDLEKAAKIARNRAYEIINCKGYTCWAIASAIADLCASILFDQKRLFPISTHLKEHDVYVSIPATIGAKGAEKIIFPAMNDAEKAQFSCIIQALQTLKSKALEFATQ